MNVAMGSQRVVVGEQGGKRKWADVGSAKSVESFSECGERDGTEEFYNRLKTISRYMP